MAELFKLYQQQEDRLKKKRQKIESNAVSAEISDDGAFEQQIGPEGLGWGSGGVFAKKISLESAIKEEMDLIRQYRYMMQHPECDNGVQEIVGEAIILDEAESPVSINLDATDLSESTKKKIIEEFDTILDLLNFDDKGQDLFSRWYIDARLAIQKITLKENRKKGIVQLRVLEPTKLKKVRTIEKGKNEQGIEVIKSVKEHYIYADQGLMYARTGLEIPVHAISYITSGLVNENGAAISYLHKAIRPLNHLKFMEDSLIIYRLARAPERRIFYVDVGSLPPKKAESYLKSIMNQHKNKISYDAETGSVVSEKSFNTIMEDYWLPRREGSRGTEVSTLPGGCLAMDTKVSLLDGRELSIAEIEAEMKTGKELWTYSVSAETGEIAPGKISWAGVTQESAKVLKMVLDNGEELICTPDHKFPVHGKGFVRADELTSNDSMMAFNRRNAPIYKGANLDYEQIFDHEKKDWVFTHRMVADHLRDSVVNYHVYDSEITNGEYEIRHHIDFNRSNNDPNNLCFMGWEDHKKLHQDNGFSIEDRLKGTIAAKEKLIKMKEDSPEEYKEFCEKTRARMSAWWNGLSEERRNEIRTKMSESRKNRIASLSGEEKQKILQQQKERGEALSAFVQELRDNDPEAFNIYRQTISEGLKKAWVNADGWREINRRNMSERNKGFWSKNQNWHKKNQQIQFSHAMLKFAIDQVHGKTTHQVTVNDVTQSFNDSLPMRNELTALNNGRNIPNWSPENGFNPNMVKKIPVAFGYKNWADFRRKESLFNHRIVSIEPLDEKIQVGTLTIDEMEEHHGFHTFALGIGIFTKNSNLSEIDDVLYFQKKLFRALNVPLGRIEPDTTFSFGRATEITREEVRFQKFISKLRRKFSMLFKDLLRTQLDLKGIMSLEEWEQYENDIFFVFLKDNYFAELKEMEVTRERMGMLNEVEAVVGRFVSRRWVQKNILRFTDEEIAEIDKENAEDKENIDDSDKDIDLEEFK